MDVYEEKVRQFPRFFDIDDVEASRHEDHYRPDDLLTVSVAAAIAARSVRTIRRAYLAGSLIAHRDGNGRCVRIRYADLVEWMMARPVRPRSGPFASAVTSHTAFGRSSRIERRDPANENLRLLKAARARNGRHAFGRDAAVALPAAD